MYLGPIVRVTPNELHVYDPDYLDEIYGSQTRKRDKYEKSAVAVGTPQASLSTLSHDHHRIRRQALNPAFSRSAISKQGSMIQEKVDKLMARFSQAFKTGTVVCLDDATAALATDVISQYAFGEDEDFLSVPDFTSWRKIIERSFALFPVIQQFPWILSLAGAIPENIFQKIFPSSVPFLEWRAKSRKLLDSALKRVNGPYGAEKNLNYKGIFRSILDSDLPAAEKTVDRMADEVITFFGSWIRNHGEDNCDSQLLPTAFEQPAKKIEGGA